MNIKQLLIILSCGLVLFIFIFKQDSKTDSVYQDANEANSKLRHKSSHSSIELNRNKDIIRSKSQDMSQAQETATLVNPKVSSLNRINTKSSQIDRKNALKGVFGIDAESSVEASAEIDPDSETERVIFSADREGIRSAVQEISGDLQECYDGWLMENPALEGRLQVSFVIEPAETMNDKPGIAQEQIEAILSDVHLKLDEVKHPMMSACLLNLFEGLHFENVSSEVKVNYPISFKAKPSVD